MQLIIRKGKVIATHPDYIRIKRKHYPECEIVRYEGDFFRFSQDPPNDPRTNEEKKQYYKDQRRLAYPEIEEQLDSMYWDQINGTANWCGTITAIKNKYPKIG